MVLLILESLGSTELIFILIMALVFFGPRKLPQISRSLGKNLADFRKASEDFKRTWDKEVRLEETGDTHSKLSHFAFEQSSMLGTESDNQPQTPAIAMPDQAIARDTTSSDAGLVSDSGTLENAADETRPSPKSEWL